MKLLRAGEEMEMAKMEAEAAGETGSA